MARDRRGIPDLLFHEQNGELVDAVRRGDVPVLRLGYRRPQELRRRPDRSGPYRLPGRRSPDHQLRHLARSVHGRMGKRGRHRRDERRLVRARVRRQPFRRHPPRRLDGRDEGGMGDLRPSPDLIRILELGRAPGHPDGIFPRRGRRFERPDPYGLVAAFQRDVVRPLRPERRPPGRRRLDGPDRREGRHGRGLVLSEGRLRQRR